MAMTDKRLEAEEKYISGTMTLRELAKDMGMNTGTLMRWSRAGAWAEKRRQVEIKATAQAMKSAVNKRAKQLEKLMDASATLEEALQAAARQFLDRLEDADEKAWDGGKMADGFRAKNLQSLAAAIGTATQTRMQLDGIMTEAEKQKLRLEKKKLAMEENRMADQGKEKVIEVVLPPEVEAMAK